MNNDFDPDACHNFKRVDPVIMPWAARHELTWYTRSKDDAIRMISIPDHVHGLTFTFGISDATGTLIEYGYALSMSRGRHFNKQDQCSLEELEDRLEYILVHHLDEDFTDHMEPTHFVRPQSREQGLLEQIQGAVRHLMGTHS